MASVHRRKIAQNIRLAVYERDGWRCQYCLRVVEPATTLQANGKHAPFLYIDGKYIWLELDHIVPRSFGGPDSVENFRAACTPCNRSKSASSSETDWYKRIAKASQILSSQVAGRATAQAAARALLGIPITIDDQGRVTTDMAALRPGKSGRHHAAH